VEAIKIHARKEIDWVNLPLDDGPTFDLLNQGRTLGIFQLESGGMQDLARNLHLDKFEEIIAVGALYRPGPMDMIPSFINRKHGREAIEYDHPWMREILAETYGIMVYQEQVMQIASKLAKYSLGEGDVLRRAMGKKDAEQMAKQREKFRQGALEMGIDEKTSMQIFDKMEKFAAYGFNKSHAAAYGFLSYVTAYFKANYPGEWMAALMTCDRDDLSKVAKFIRECQAMNISILPPDVNEAHAAFVATPQGIRFAMTGIKGIGEGVVEAILQERSKRGPFESLYHFFKRIDTKKVGKKVVENLIDAGAFDFTGWSRDALRESVEPIYEASAKEQADQAKGVLSLFGKMDDFTQGRFLKEPAVKNKRPLLEKLLKEKELLGFFLTGHPLDNYRPILSRLSCIPLSQLDDLDHDAVFRAAFIVESIQVRLSSKTQKKFAILMINDGMESYELPIWSDLYEEKQMLLKENQLLYAVLQVDKREEIVKLSCRWLDDLTRADEAMIEDCDRAFDKAKSFVARQSKFSKGKEGQKEKMKPEKKVEEKEISLKFDADKGRLSHIIQIKEIFEQHRGPVPVYIEFISGEAKVATLQIDSRWGVTDTPQLYEALQKLACLILS
jgi:DNA polymerase-3 subunit alpha